MQKIIAHADPIILRQYEAILRGLVFSLNMEDNLPALGLEAVTLYDSLPQHLKPLAQTIQFAEKIGARELGGSAGVIYIPEVHTPDEYGDKRAINWLERLRTQGYDKPLIACTTYAFNTPYLESIAQSADFSCQTCDEKAIIGFLREKLASKL